MKSIVWQALMALAAMLVALMGCSNNSSVVSTGDWPARPSSVTFWFPVQSGYSTTFEEHGADGGIRTMTLQIGGQASIAGSPVTQWFLLNGSGALDTNYFVTTDVAVNVYENTVAEPEQILRMPLVPGATWKRFPQYDDTGRDTVSIITGETGDTLPPAGGGARKVFPTTGSNTMKVERTEDIVLRNGTSYTGTLRIVNTNPSGSENRYWLAAGIGLVKYTIGATAARPDGEKSGELVAYTK